MLDHAIKSWVENIRAIRDRYEQAHEELFGIYVETDMSTHTQTYLTAKLYLQEYREIQRQALILQTALLQKGTS